MEKDRKAPVFLSVCMNPTLQKTLVLKNFIPDRVNRLGDHRFDASGKGINVSRVLAQLGRDCVHLTQLGGSLRPVFLELCAGDGFKLKWAESGSEIRFAFTLLDLEKKQVTEIVEEPEKVGEGTEERLLAAFNEVIPDVSWLIVSGTKAGGFSGSLIPEMAGRAKKSGARVILDIRGEDLLNSLLCKPEIIKPNIDEFAATFTPEIPGGRLEMAKASEICRELWAEYGCGIVLTRGSQSLWYAEEGTLEEYPVETALPLNTTGSGDAFTAGLASALENGARLKDALAEASRCGRLNALLLRPGVIR